MARILSPKQQKFVELYAACGNATAAAREAGYKKPNPQGAENLAKPSIQAALAELTANIFSERIAGIKERQSFWTAVMRGIDIYCNLDKDGEDAQLAAKIDMKDRIKASELLGKAQGDFIERVEHTLGPIAPDWSALLRPPGPEAH